MSQSEWCTGFRNAGYAPAVNLVAGNRQPCRQMNCADSIGDFFRFKVGFYFQQSQPDRFGRIALDPVSVDDAPSKHLVASADSNNPSTCATMPHEEILPARAAHPFQIPHPALVPRHAYYF